MSNSETAISLKDVELYFSSPFGSVNVLKGISFDVKKGETVAILGPSGSGKTSLLMLIAGMEKPTFGEVMVAGRKVSSLSESDLAAFRKSNIGIIFQSFNLIPTMTAHENVAAPLEIKGDKEASVKAARILREIGLAERLSHFPSQLSGGEQQRVAIARAFVTSPQILLADEPTGNLDTETGRQVIDIIFSLHQKMGSTLLFITHDNALAEKCQRIIRIEGGEVKGSS